MTNESLIETHNYPEGVTLSWEEELEVATLVFNVSGVVKTVTFPVIGLVMPPQELAQYLARNGILLDLDEIQAMRECIFGEDDENI